MQPSIRLIDPQGHTRATFNAPVTSEDLLRAALDFGPADKFVVCIVAPSEWSLAVLRADRYSTLEPIGPKVPEVCRSQWNAMRAAMAETAWLDTVDAGWAAVITETPAIPSAGDVEGIWRVSGDCLGKGVAGTPAGPRGW